MANRKRTDLIVVHTTATKTKYALTVASLRNMHKQRGFSDIGYGSWISRSGKKMQGRGDDKIGAHVRGWNSNSVGTAWEGGFAGNDMTADQEAALLKEVRRLSKKYPNAKVTGHRELSPDSDGDGQVEPHEWLKMCPWFNAEAWAKSNGLPYANFSGHDTDKPMDIQEGPDTRIAWLQSLLREEGFNIVADGWDGPKTAAAIKVFQSDHQLKENGTFDGPTVALLRSRADDRRCTNVIEKEVVSPAAKKVVSDAAAKGRFSKTEVTSVLVGVGGAVTLGEKALEVSNKAKGVLDGFTSMGWTGLILVMVMIGGGYIWLERRRKKADAAEALSELDTDSAREGN